MIKFARKCDVTGRGMNEGYVFGDGEQYACDKESALKIAQEYGYEDLDEAFKDDAYDYAEWYDENFDYDVYYDAEGNEYEL